MQRLCRVLKGPGCYVCGLCGRRYQNINDAWKCLTSNGLGINSLPVIATKNNSQTFQCLLCGKTYANQQDTALCMISDLNVSRFPKALGEHLLSLVSALVNESGKTKRDVLVSRQGTMGSPSPKGGQKFVPPPIPTQQPENTDKQIQETNPEDVSGTKEDKDIVQAQSVPDTELPSAEEPPATSGDPMDHESDVNQKPKEVEKPILYRKSGQKPFVRHNANYVCTVCNEKFFTKMEVENHFEEHPIMDEV